MEVIARKDAISQVLTHYFTGKPCKHGHFSKRRVPCGSCLECRKQYYVDNKVALDLSKNKWRKDNRERHLAMAKKWRCDHREESTASNLSWQRNNRERSNKIKRAWAARNKPYLASQDRSRQAAKKQRMPIWANKEAIHFFYECRPSDCEVDHIIPLQGKYISGFHVETNLQWLPKTENRKKSNKFEEQ